MLSPPFTEAIRDPRRHYSILGRRGCFDLRKNKSKIKELCKGKGISVTSVGKELGLSNGLISKWSRAEPTISNLKKIADFFGKSIEYFGE